MANETPSGQTFSSNEAALPVEERAPLKRKSDEILGNDQKRRQRSEESSIVEQDRRVIISELFDTYALWTKTIIALKAGLWMLKFKFILCPHLIFLSFISISLLLGELVKEPSIFLWLSFLLVMYRYCQEKIHVDHSWVKSFLKIWYLVSLCVIFWLSFLFHWTI